MMGDARHNQRDNRIEGGRVSHPIIYVGGRVPRRDFQPMKRVLFFVLSASAVFAQVVPNRYILELSGEPAATLNLRRGAIFDAHRTVVRQSQTAARAAVAAHGGTVVESMDTVFNGTDRERIPDARPPSCSRFPARCACTPYAGFSPCRATRCLCTKSPTRGIYCLSVKTARVRGIKIGMIDTGVDVNNPAFSDALPPVAGIPEGAGGERHEVHQRQDHRRQELPTPLLPDGGDADADDMKMATRLRHGAGRRRRQGQHAVRAVERRRAKGVHGQL